jgi:hypothetical protein
MPRGSKPGERRGGRQRGTLNKKTVLRNAAISAATCDPNISPRDFMLGLMRNCDLPVADRFAAAQAALPLVHAKVSTGKTNAAASGEYGYDRCDVNVKQKSESTARVTPSRETGNGIPHSAKSAELSPLDFFLEVMRSPDVPIDVRQRAARIAAPFVHPKPASRKATLVINDPYGFVVDPEAARVLRDAYRRHFRLYQTIHMRGWDDRQHWEALHRYQELERSLGESTECPVCYTSVDEHEDLERRDELFKKWKRGKRPYQLTPEEDAEEAHLYGRIAAYRAARGRDSKHMRALKELGDKRTAVEQNELDALEARYRHVRSNSLRLVAP